MKRLLLSMLLIMHSAFAVEHKETRKVKPYVVYVQNPHHHPEHPFYHHYYWSSPLYRACDLLWQSAKIAAGVLSLSVAVRETINICKNDSWPCRALKRRWGAAWNSDYWTFAQCFTMTVAPYILGPMGIRSGWYGLHRSRLNKSKSD